MRRVSTAILMLVTVAGAAVSALERTVPGPVRPIPVTAIGEAIEKAPVQVDSDDAGASASTARWRARFHAAGVEIGTGTDTAAFRFSLTAWQRGGTAFALPRVAPRTRGHVVEFVRGLVRERYVAREGGIEQVFVLDELPPGDGDVELVARVDGPAAVTAQGLIFGTGAAAITYGVPIAFDAAGAPVPVEAIARDGQLRLRLAGAAVARARLPLTIDPLIRPALGVATNGFTPRIVYNSRRAEFLAVWGGSALQSRRFSADGTPLGPAVTLPVTGNAPDAAYLLTTDQYLFVYQKQTGGPFSEIWGLLLDSVGTPVGSEFEISDDTGLYSVRPVVEASNFVAPAASATTPYLVCWSAGKDAGDDDLGAQDSSDVFCQRTAANGAELVPDFRVNAVATGEGQFARDSVIAFDPIAQRYLVAWTQSNQILARPYWTALGTQVTATEAGAIQARESDIAFDPSSRRYLIVWEEDRTAGNSKLWGQLLGSASNPALVGGNINVPLPAPYGPAAETPAVYAEPGGFVVIYPRRPTGAPAGDDDADMYAAYVRADGATSSDRLGLFYFDVGDVQDEDPVAAVAPLHHLGVALWWHDSASDEIFRATLLGRFSHFVHGRSGNLGGTAGSDPVVFRTSTGGWWVKTSSGTRTFSWGSYGDVPILMDIDGDGDADPTVWRPSTGAWYTLNEGTLASSTTTWGGAGDIPVVGDYLGDNRDDFAVFRPAAGAWFIRENGGPGTLAVSWGMVGDIPVPADYDGDGKLELGVFRPSNGTWYTVETTGASPTVVAWGTAGDVPLPGQFVGTARADRVVWRPSTGVWHIKDGESGAASSHSFGQSGDMPMPLDYFADGTLDLTVWRPGTGFWYISDPWAAMSASFQWGAAGDLPAGR